MEWIELGELGEVLSGYAFKSKKYVNKGIRVIRITNVQNGYLEDDDPKYYSEEDIEGLERYLLLEDDILISLTGNVGRVAKLEKKFLPAALNQRVACVRANKSISDEYLYYMLNSNYFENRCISQSKGVAQKNLGITNLKKIKIPVPSMEIQEKIVKVLDQAQALIDKRKEQIEALDQLIESIFYTMFGDPVRNDRKIPETLLEEICNLKAGKFIKASQISDSHEDNRYPCYGGNGLRGYVPEYTHEGSYPLIGRQGALCGNINFAEGKFYATEHAIVVRPISELDISWLYIMLNKMNLNRLASGAAQPGLNVGTLKQLHVINPSIKSQVEFGNKFKEIQNLKYIMEKSLNENEDNYNSLMQRAFKGQLF